MFKTIRIFSAAPIVIAAIAACLGCTVSAQNIAARDDVVRPIRGSRVAVPIELVSIERQSVARDFVQKLVPGAALDGDSATVEVLDLAVAARARDLALLPDARQPQLFIGLTPYPVQRVEYSNWDLEKEKPLSPREPVAEVHYYHFFIPDWRNLDEGQNMVLTVLAAPEYRRRIDDSPTTLVLRTAFPEIGRAIPQFAPSQYLQDQ